MTASTYDIIIKYEKELANGQVSEETREAYDLLAFQMKHDND